MRIAEFLQNRISVPKRQWKIEDAKGFSFVELLVSIVLLSLVILGISTFLSTVNRNYRHNQKEVDLQLESQTVMNQLKDLMIDTTKGITKVEDAGNGTVDLYIYNDTFYYRIVWIKATKSLYVRVYGVNDEAETPFLTNQADIMSSCLADYQVSVDQVESKRVVGFDMVFQYEDDDSQTYSSSNNISLRNRLIVGKERDEIYKGEAGKNQEIFASSIEVTPHIYVWPGSNHVLNAIVKSATGGVPSQAVTWEFENDGSEGGEIFSDHRSDQNATQINQGVIYIGKNEQGQGVNVGNDKYCFYLCAKANSKDSAGNTITVVSTKVTVHVIQMTGLELSDDADSSELIRGDSVVLKATMQGYNLDQLSIANQGGVVVQAFKTGTTERNPYCTITQKKNFGNQRQQEAVLTVLPTFSVATSITVTARMNINGQVFESNAITYQVADVDSSSSIMDMVITPSKTGSQTEWLRGETKTISFRNIPEVFTYSIAGNVYLLNQYELYIQYYFENSETGEASSETQLVKTEYNYVKLLQFQTKLLQASGQKATLSVETPFRQYDHVTVTAYIVSAGDSITNAAGKTESQTFIIPEVKLSFKKNQMEPDWRSQIHVFMTDAATSFQVYALVTGGFEENCYPVLASSNVKLLLQSDKEAKGTYTIQLGRTGRADHSYAVTFQGTRNTKDFKAGLEAYLYYQNTSQDSKILVSYRMANSWYAYGYEYVVYTKNGAGAVKSPYDYLPTPSDLGLADGEETDYYCDSINRFHITWDSKNKYWIAVKQVYTQSTWMDAYLDPTYTVRIRYRYQKKMNGWEYIG